MDTTTNRLNYLSMTGIDSLDDAHEDLTELEIKVDQNTANIDVLDVSMDLVTTATDLNTANIASNVVDIATNAANIASNATNVASNTSAIASNAANIASNDVDIASNATNIASNDVDIASNTSNITTNTTNIATNTTNIASNTSNISTNATNIASNTSNISANSSNIASNTANIATNATSISNITTQPMTISGAKTFSSTLTVSGNQEIYYKGNTLDSQFNSSGSNATYNNLTVTGTLSGTTIASKAPLANPVFTGNATVGGSLVIPHATAGYSSSLSANGLNIISATQGNTHIGASYNATYLSSVNGTRVRTFNGSGYSTTADIFSSGILLNTNTTVNGTLQISGLSTFTDNVSIYNSAFNPGNMTSGGPVYHSIIKLGGNDFSPQLRAKRANGYSDRTDFQIWTSGVGTVAAPLVTIGGYNARNVGIGTETPSEKLDVVGNATVSGSITGGTAMIRNNYNSLATFQHKDVSTTGDFAVGQTATGVTYLNASPGQNMYFKFGNATTGGIWSSSLLTIYSNFTVTGDLEIGSNVSLTEATSSNNFNSLKLKSGYSVRYDVANTRIDTVVNYTRNLTFTSTGVQLARYSTSQRHYYGIEKDGGAKVPICNICFGFYQKANLNTTGYMNHAPTQDNSLSNAIKWINVPFDIQIHSISFSTDGGTSDYTERNYDFQVYKRVYDGGGVPSNIAVGSTISFDGVGGGEFLSSVFATTGMIPAGDNIGLFLTLSGDSGAEVCVKLWCYQV